MLYGEFGFEIEKVLNTFSNGEQSIDILLLKNGDVITEDNFYIGDINDNEIEDKIDDFGEGWREKHIGINQIGQIITVLLMMKLKTLWMMI